MASQSGGFFHLTEIEQQQSLTGKRYLEFLRVPLSAGLYVFPGGAPIRKARTSKTRCIT